VGEKGKVIKLELFFIKFGVNPAFSGGVTGLRIDLSVTDRVGSLEDLSIGFRVSLM
jgi:hypothetical protein